jgi:hypothetical protein
MKVIAQILTDIIDGSAPFRSLQPDDTMQKKQALVEWRRRQGDLLLRLEQAVYSEIDCVDGPNKSQFRQVYKSSFSDLRHRLALVQAEWPVVAIYEDIASFKRSSAALDMAAKDLFQKIISDFGLSARLQI